MNNFNDLLDLLRLEVSLYHNARVCGDWNIREHELGSTCFHMPTQGGCKLMVPDHGEWELHSGDLVIFPKELPHSMQPLSPQAGPQQHLAIAESQEVTGTSMLCGAANLMHAGSEQLLSVLPAVMVISGEKAKHWLEPLNTLIVNESLRGADLQSPILNRLSELLFSYALRCFAENTQHPPGLLALYASAKLQAAVSAIHQQPNAPWQLASLAQRCAMSRTQFANVFKATAGKTAMEYLSWWRLQLAWQQLNQGASVEQTADKVGYQSTAAFSRAFKQTFGQTVGQVRRHARRHR